MSESTDFEDLDLLDGGDLKAVFDQLGPDEVTAALWGAPAGLRARLLRKLPRKSLQSVEQAIAATEHLSFDQVHRAQRSAVDVMCQLSRTGQIAFDAPEDMVA